LPIVICPLRDGPLLAAALIFTTPLPDPASPLAIVSHDAPLDAVHAQPAALLTAIDKSDAAPEPIVREPGATATAQPPA